MASGWNLWVWLQCIGVVSGCCVRRYIDILTIIINFPYSICISSFLAAASLLLFSFLKCFFVLVYVIFVQYIANITQRTFTIVKKKSRSREYNYLIISIIKNVECASTARARVSPETSTCEVPNDV